MKIFGDCLFDKALSGDRLWSGAISPRPLVQGLKTGDGSKKTFSHCWQGDECDGEITQTLRTIIFYRGRISLEECTFSMYLDIL